MKEETKNRDMTDGGKSPRRKSVAAECCKFDPVAAIGVK